MRHRFPADEPELRLGSDPALQLRWAAMTAPIQKPMWFSLPMAALQHHLLGRGTLRPKDGCGTIFNLKPPPRPVRPRSARGRRRCFISSPVSDGIGPVGTVVFDQTGNLYGAATAGGFRNGGTVFELAPWRGQDRKSSIASYGYPGGGVIFDQLRQPLWHGFHQAATARARSIS